MSAVDNSSSPARDLTLRAHSTVREPAQFSGHTLAGFPPGNLLATLRAP